MALASYAITQGAAGATTVVAAPAAGESIRVVNYLVVLDAAGSFKWSDGTTDWSGVIPCAANGGVSAQGTKSEPLLSCARGKALVLTSVTGKAFGHVTVDIR